MTDADQVWSSFSRDPRDPGSADLRASDADREVVHQALGEAYADGRLDAGELEARTEQTQAARTLGQLVPPLEGLVALRATAGLLPEPPPRDRAVEAWRKERREALWGLLSVSVVVWTIWLAGSFGDGGFDPYFPWPLFVTMAAALNLGRIQFQRDTMVEEAQRRLEKKRRKEIERRRREEDP